MHTNNNKTNKSNPDKVNKTRETLEVHSQEFPKIMYRFWWVTTNWTREIKFGKQYEASKKLYFQLTCGFSYSTFVSAGNPDGLNLKTYPADQIIKEGM